MTTPAECLRKIADRLEAGEPEDEWGPILWLLGKAMSRPRPQTGSRRK